VSCWLDVGRRFPLPLRCSVSNSNDLLSARIGRRFRIEAQARDFAPAVRIESRASGIPTRNGTGAGGRDKKPGTVTLHNVLEDLARPCRMHDSNSCIE